MEYITKNDKPELQLSTMNERMGNGHKLYIAAWTFEIFAAIIGILVAIVTGITSYKTFQNLSTTSGLSIDQWSDVILGFVPFIMVALAELLKIPMVYLVYINRHLITKLFFSIILIGLTFITFETIFNGFERQFNNITTKVRIPTESLQEKRKQINKRESYIERNENRSEVDIVDKYYRESIADNKTNDERLKSIDKQILQIKTKNSTQTNSELGIKQKKLKNLIKKRDENIKNATKIEEDIIKNEQRKDERIKLISNWFFCNEECIDAKSEIKKLKANNAKLNSQLNENNLQMDDLQSKIEHTQKQIENMQAKLTKLIADNSQIKSLRQEKINIQNSHNKAVTERNSRKQQEIQRLQLIKDKVSSDKSEINALNSEIEGLRKDINKYNSLTQIYRLAARYMNFIKEPYECKNANLPTKNSCIKSGGTWQKTAEITASDVTSNAVSKVSLVWFGSLAFLVSIMGVVLAFGALILKHPNKKFHNDEGSKRSISKTVRGVFASILKKARKPNRIIEIPKEIIKEVPVDKVVFKEIPVEVVKKEIIHTPIYTNDPDLLKFGTTKIKDILKDDE